MMETEKSKRIEQILATDVTREQLAEALWCAESSQRMWHGCAEKNRSFRLKAEAENAKLRSMVHDMRYCIKRNHRCDDCDFNVGTDCLLFININKRMRELGIEVDYGQQRDV